MIEQHQRNGSHPDGQISCAHNELLFDQPQWFTVAVGRDVSAR